MYQVISTAALFGSMFALASVPTSPRFSAIARLFPPTRAPFIAAAIVVVFFAIFAANHTAQMMICNFSIAMALSLLMVTGFAFGSFIVENERLPMRYRILTSAGFFVYGQAIVFAFVLIFPHASL